MCPLVVYGGLNGDGRLREMSARNQKNVSQAGDVAVWDRGVRSFHWLLAASVTGALFTGFFADAPWLDLHVIFGVSIVVLIAFRLVWGFLGSTYARFSNFIASPRMTMDHLRAIRKGGDHRCLGHNPLGAWMILALLGVLAAACAAGVVVLGGVVKEGPLAAFTTYATAREVKEIHEFLAYAALGLIGLHVLGALFESWRSSENLPRAMVTGRKRYAPEADAVKTVRGHPLFASILLVVAAAGGAQAVAHYSALPAYRTPAEPLDRTYAKECGSCHSPHHPSLAPAATWRKIMAGLDNHFGENATLTPELTKQLTSYLLSNSAETWDTRPANVLRAVNPDEPLRITAIAKWKRIHREIPDEVFKSKPIGGKLNCSNCHGDAETGRFAPRAIAIKKETAK
jgi:cytochrome b